MMGLRVWSVWILLPLRIYNMAEGQITKPPHPLMSLCLSCACVWDEYIKICVPHCLLVVCLLDYTAVNHLNINYLSLIMVFCHVFCRLHITSTKELHWPCLWWRICLLEMSSQNHHQHPVFFLWPYCTKSSDVSFSLSPFLCDFN